MMIKMIYSAMTEAVEYFVCTRKQHCTHQDNGTWLGDSAQSFSTFKTEHFTNTPRNYRH